MMIVVVCLKVLQAKQLVKVTTDYVLHIYMFSRVYVNMFTTK